MPVLLGLLCIAAGGYGHFAVQAQVQNPLCFEIPVGTPEYEELCNDSGEPGEEGNGGIVVTLNALPASIQRGQSVLLTWDTYVVSDPSASPVADQTTSTNFSTGGAIRGSAYVAPQTTTTYTVTWSRYVNSPSGPPYLVYQQTKQVTVTVAEDPGLTVSCSVAPSQIAAGGSATWTAAVSGGTDSYTYLWSGSDGLSGTGSSVAGTYQNPGTKTASLTVTSEFASQTVACSNSLTVNASGPTAALTANPVSVTQGSSSVLTHACTDATSASIDHGVGAVTPTVPPGATVSVTPTTTTTYTLTCTGSGGTATSFVTVTVTPKPPPPTGLSHACNANGTSVTLSWNAAPGADNYYVRLYDGITGYAGYTDGYTGTSITYPVVAGRYYDWWVHSNIGAPDYNPAHYSDAAYGSFTCPPQSQPTPPTSCTVDNSNPAVGATVTYTAHGGSGPYTWTPSGGTGPAGTGSTITRTYSVAGPYTMQVSGNGSSAINCTVVNAGPVSCGTGTATITATPDRVRKGSSTSLRWSATNVDTSCSITGTDGYSATAVPTSCTVPLSAPVSRTINGQVVYRINCDSGESTAEAVVNIPGQFLEF